MERIINVYSGNMSMKTKKYPEFQNLHVQEGLFRKLTSDFRQPANSSEPLPVFGSLLITSGGTSRGTIEESLCLRVALYYHFEGGVSSNEGAGNRIGNYFAG